MSDAGNTSSTNNPSKKLKISNNNSSSSSSSSMATPTTTSLINRDDNDEKDDFQILREYILKCPHLGSDSPAIKAALEGMEKEEKRRIRDAKLRSKFGGSGSSNNNNYNSNKSNNSNHDGDNEIVVVEKDVDDEDAFILEGISNSNNNDEDMEWQDVPPKDVDDEEDDVVVNVPAVRAIGDSFSMEDEAPTKTTAERESCFLGKTLAKACIDAIASQQQHQRHKPVVVSTPLAAIAVALHVSLRSDILGFRCTGIPEDATTTVGTTGKAKKIGFAPPIRELPRTEFLPRGWDQSSSSSPEPLRYRKADTGAVILTVEGLPSKEDDGTSNSSSSYCRVTFGPANRKQHDPSACPRLEFPLAEHMNLDSWNAAAKPTGGVKKIPPSLHYKNLSGLLTKFCRTFDLGAVETNSNNSNPKNNNDSVMGAYDTAGMGRSTKIAGNGSNSVNNSSKMEALGVFGSTMESRPARGYPVPSTLDQAFPSAAAASRRLPDPRLLVDLPNHGDFAGDLLPSGLHDPRFAGGRMGMGGTGNLMGPNHPMFAPDGSLDGQGNFPSHLGGGPGRMQPRFDPIVPPCLGGGPPNPNGHQNRNRNRNQRRTPGEPNPDHLPPPNSLGDSMFM